MSGGKNPGGAERFSEREVASSAEDGLPPPPDAKQPVERPAVFLSASGLACRNCANQAWMVIAGTLSSARLHRINRLLSQKPPRHIARAFGLQLFKRFDGVERRVRRQYDVVAPEQRGILCERLDRHHVERGAAQIAAVERRDQGGLVHQGS